MEDHRALKLAAQNIMAHFPVFLSDSNLLVKDWLVAHKEAPPRGFERLRAREMSSKPGMSTIVSFVRNWITELSEFTEQFEDSLRYAEAVWWGEDCLGGVKEAWIRLIYEDCPDLTPPNEVRSGDLRNKLFLCVCGPFVHHVSDRGSKNAFVELVDTLVGYLRDSTLILLSCRKDKDNIVVALGNRIFSESKDRVLAQFDMVSPRGEKSLTLSKVLSAEQQDFLSRFDLAQSEKLSYAELCVTRLAMVMESYRAFVRVSRATVTPKDYERFLYARMLMERFGGYFLSSKDTFVVRVELEHLVKQISNYCMHSRGLERLLSPDASEREDNPLPSHASNFRDSHVADDEDMSSETTSEIDLDDSD